jgi:hypothetical protein
MLYLGTTPATGVHSIGVAYCSFAVYSIAITAPSNTQRHPRIVQMPGLDYRLLLVHGRESKIGARDTV